MIKKEETQIIGSWTFDGRNIIKDENCQRIELLISTYLKKIASDESGWLTLYKDTGDGRFWELSYPHGEMHGGGPPSLISLPEGDVEKKYAKI